MINRDEFVAQLEKYVKKAPLKVEDIQSNIIGEKDAQELVAMQNEYVREKKVYENYDFDHNDPAVRARREE